MCGYRTNECPKYFWTHFWTVTTFLQVWSRGFLAGNWLFCIMSVMKTGKGFGFKWEKILRVIPDFCLFHYLMWVIPYLYCVNILRDNVVNRWWIDRRQMMTLCVHVDFNACRVSVYLQQVSCCMKIWGVCELLSLGSWRNSKPLWGLCCWNVERQKKS